MDVVIIINSKFVHSFSHLTHERTGRGDTMDQQQAQHGFRVQSQHLARGDCVLAALLHVRRLQLGLVAAARFPAVSAP